MPDLDSIHTPARRDKHLWATLLYVAIVTLNHKLGLALTSGELLVLGGTLSAYMGQSQIGAWAKLQTLTNSEAKK
jgi:hypothetical protein